LLLGGKFALGDTYWLLSDSFIIALYISENFFAENYTPRCITS
jgi:hypothetical protein